MVADSLLQMQELPLAPYMIVDENDSVIPDSPVY